MDHGRSLSGRERRADLAGAIGVLFAAFLFSLQCSNHLWHKGNVKTDSNVFYYVARVMLRGGMPYRDTFDHKGPLLYVLNVLGLRIAQWRGIWVIELFFIAGTFYLIYRTARLLSGPLFSFFVVMAAGALLYEFFDGGNYSEEYALLFISGALYIFADYFLNGTITNLRLLLCGGCFGAVLMLRPNMVAVWVVMCLGVLYQCIREKKTADLARFLLFFIAGTLIVCVPFIVWLVINGAFSAFIDCYLTFNTLYTASTQGTMQTAYRVDALVHFMRYRILLIAACAAVLDSARSKKLCSSLHAIFFFVTLILLSISAESYDHYGIVMIPAIVYPLASIGRMIREDDHSASLRVYAALFFLPTLILPNWLEMTNKAFYDYATRDQTFFYMCDIEAGEIINTYSGPEDEILVCGNWDGLYNYTDRFSVSYYSYQNMPCYLDPARMQRFMQEVEASEPKVTAMMDGCYVEKDIRNYAAANGYEEVFHKEYDGYSTTILRKAE